MLTNVQNKVKRFWWEGSGVISLLFCRSAVGSVISREGRDMELVNGVWATSLDSSLRCAAFRMTGVGRCVQGDSEGMLRSEWQNKRAFLFRLYIRLSVPEGEGTTGLKSARSNNASGCGGAR